MPGSTVTMFPAASTSSERCDSRGPSWTSSPTPCPSPCPKRSPKPPLSITVRAAPSTSRARAPALTASTPAICARQHQLVDDPSLLIGLAGGDRARAVRAVAVELGAPVDHDQLAARRPRRRAGLRAAAPRAGRRPRSSQSSGAGRPAAASPARARAPARARLRPASPPSSSRSQRRVGEPAGAADPLDLVGLLDRPQPLHDPLDADQLHPVGEQLAQPGVGPDRHVGVLEPEPERAFGEHVLDVVEQLLGSSAAVKRGSDLRGGLLDVAEVGDEHPRVGPDHGDPVGARVARQVADVDEVGDQQQVDAGLREQLDDAIGAVAHLPAD